MTELLRPPHSNEAEQSLLGAILLSGLGRSTEILTSQDFYLHKHQLIFQAAVEIDRSGERVDVVTVGEWFRHQKALDRIDSGAYLTELANETPGSANMLGWARIVRAKSRLRQLIEIGGEISDQAMLAADPEPIIERFEALLASNAKPGSGGPRTLGQISASLIDRLDTLESTEQRVETGLIDIDDRVIGFLPPELVVIAGRPGTGKTAAMQGILEHNARNRPVLCFSAEMSAEQILKRMISAAVDSKKLRDPRQLSMLDRQDMMREIQRVQRDFKILIDDTGGIDIDQLTATAKRAKREHDIAMVAVDYMQLLEGSAENRFQTVSLVSRRLKKLAKDLDTPVVVVSQLNRNLESRPDKRPHMGDLRETGQLEQDADVVILLYRHKYYHPEFESEITEWIIGKHRDAEPGTELVLWDGPKTRFLNASHDEKARYWQALREPKTTNRRSSKFAELAGEAP